MEDCSIYHVFPEDSKLEGTDQRQGQLLVIRGLTYCYWEDSARFRIKQIKSDEVQSFLRNNYGVKRG